MAVFDTAEVEIVPELDSFDNELDAGVERAMQRLRDTVSSALDDFESSFEQAAGEAGDSLDDIDPDFSDVTQGADAAGSDVVDAFDEAADASDDALSNVEGDFSGLEDAADEAAQSVTGSFDGAGDEISDSIDEGVEESSSILERLIGLARSAADSVSSAFSGTGEEIGDEFDEAADGADTLQSAVVRLGATIGGIAAFRQAVLDAEELNSQMIILESQFDETGRGAGFLADELRGMARESAIRLGIDTSDVVRAQQQVLLFTDLTGDGFNRATELAADMAAFMGRDVPNAARLLARALDDPTLGLQLLERQAGRFDEALIQQVETLDAAGDAVGAQSLILEELEGRFGGVAEASADSSARIAQAGRESLRAFGEPVIGEIDANIDQLLGLIESFVPVMSNLGEAFGTVVTIIAELSPALIGLADLVGSIPPDFFQAAAAAIALNRGLTLIRRNPVVATITGLALALGLVAGEGENAAASIAEVELSTDRLARGQVDEQAQALVGTFTDLANVSVDIGDRLSAIEALSPQNFDLFRAFDTGAVEAREFEEAIADAEEEFRDFDQVLQGMVRGGSADQVADILDLMEERSGLTSAQFDEFASRVLPATTAELTRTAEAAEDMAIATEAVDAVLSDISGNLEGTPRQLGELAIAIRDSEDAAQDAAVAAEELGISEEDLVRITPQVADAFESLAQSVQTNMPNVGTAVENAFAAAQEAEEDFTFENFVGELEDTLEDARNFNTNVQSLIDAGFTEIARVALERGPEFASAAADALSDPDILRDAEGLMDDIGTEVDRGLNNAARIGFREAGDAGEDIISGFESGTRGAGAVGRAAANGVISGIGSRSNAAERRARGLMSGAISSARNRAGGSFGVGVGFATGIINGIDREVNNVANAAAGIARTAVSSASRYLNIASPSRVTAREIGMPFTQGIAVGMAEAQSDVDRTFQNIIDGLMEQTTFSPVRLGDVSRGEWDQLLDAGWRGDPTDRMEALYPPGFDASDIGTRIPQSAGQASQSIPLEIRSDGSDLSELLVRVLTEAVRIRGGDVQQVLGQSDRR